MKRTTSDMYVAPKVEWTGMSMLLRYHRTMHMCHIHDVVVVMHVSLHVFFHGNMYMLLS